jgi:hypothetical protein
MALAPPPVFREGDKKFTSHVREAIDIYIFGQDCIPRVSLASAARLLAALRAVDKLDLSPKQTLSVLAADSDEKSLDEETQKNLASVSDAVAEAPQERFPFLDHPGKVHYLYPRKGDEAKV